MGMQFDHSTARGEVLSDLRENASDGRLTRVLKRIPDGLKKAIEDNHQGIKASPHLVKELKAHVAVLDALHGSPRNPEALKLADDLDGAGPTLKAPDPVAQQLLERLSWRSLRRRPHSPVCPLARYLRARVLQEAVAPFAFEEIRQELAMVTVIAGYAGNLVALEDRIAAAQAGMKSVSSGMSKLGRGFFALGHCEPDLRSHEEFQRRPELREIARRLDWEIHDCGGWVVSLHALARCSDHRLLRNLLLDEFPLGGPRRIKTQRLKPRKCVVENIERVIGYTMKQHDHIEQIRAAVERAGLPGGGKIEELFLGPGLEKEWSGFGFDHAVRQYALFLDRMGFDGIEVNVINHLAHGWWKADEYQWFMTIGEFDRLHGYSTPETFRPRLTTRGKNGRRRNLPYPGFRRFPAGGNKLG